MRPGWTIGTIGNSSTYETKHFRLLLLGLVLAAPVGAEEANPPPVIPATEEYVVTGSPADRTILLRDVVFDSPGAENLGEALRDLPGVNGVRRSPSTSEPVIRGQGWERVRTRVNGHTLNGAGPARMDPPASVLSPTAILGVKVVKALPSVTLGPGGTGGAIEISSDFERDPERDPDFAGRLSHTYMTVGDDYTGQLELMGGNDWLDIHVGAYGRNGGDYDSARGTRVPNDHTSFGGSFSLGVRPTEKQRISVSFIDAERRDVSFPALPMDATLITSRTVTAGWRFDGDGGLFQRLELRGGFSHVRHTMDNDGKSNRGMMAAETTSDADSISAGLLTHWNITPKLRLAAGVDFENLERDATRGRTLLMSGMYFQDRIWPDAHQWDLGAYMEAELDLAENWNLRWGGRVDRVESDARATGDPSLQMRTVSENYAFYNGTGAGDIERSETLGSGNLLIEWNGLNGLNGHLGAGITTRAAGVTERYFAFAPAPGGFQIGNPALDAEKKVELAAGLEWHSTYLDLSVTGFHAWFRDYILSTTIAMVDVDGDLIPDRIRGFRNVNARSYGVEAAAEFRIGSHWSLPAQLSYVRARNTSDGRDLPEIPAFEASVALRYDSVTAGLPWWLQLGGRFVHSQDRVDVVFGEDPTPAFEVFHLRAGIELFEHAVVTMGVENLLDEEFHEHLTREALLPSGDLTSGDEVPAPGRSLYVSLRWEL